MKTIRIELDGSDVMTSREAGLGFRIATEAALQESATDDVVLDFSALRNATQSFLDEVVGVLVFSHGPDVLQRLVFEGCAPSIRTLLEYVVVDRINARERMPR